jgi:tetratricopeptide (TPR) repeat protein
MDLTTLTLAVMLAVSALGIDTVWHHKDVLMETSAAGKLDKTTLDINTMNLILKHEVDRMSATQSVVTKPRIRTDKGDGIGMAIATAANMQSIAYALQSQFGYHSDQIKLALFGEDGTAKVLVTGSGSTPVATFEQLVVQEKDETVVELVRRAALVGLARIDPYIAALNLLQRHEIDRDFTHVQGLVEFAKSQLPPKPLSLDRSLLENLQGIMALFGNDPTIAHDWFKRAVTSAPDSTVALLNLSFADLQINRFQEVSDRLEGMVTRHPSQDPILLCTTYATWAASRLGLGDVNGADRLMAKAIEVYPHSAIAYNLWSDVKREKGDQEAADRMREKALEASDTFENYAEVAALYFQLAWRDRQPVLRSQFANPAVVRFH